MAKKFETIADFCKEALHNGEGGSGSGESSGGGEPLMIHESISGSKATMDKTWQEIYDAFTAGRAVIDIPSNDTENYPTAGSVVAVTGYRDSGSYSVSFYRAGSLAEYHANSADDYPNYTYTD